MTEKTINLNDKEISLRLVKCFNCGNAFYTNSQENRGPCGYCGDSEVIYLRNLEEEAER